MKTLKLFLLIVFLIPLFSLAQSLPQLAPVNPEFAAHQSRQQSAQFTSDGYALGENPSPTLKFFDPHYTPSINTTKLEASYDLRDVNGGNWLSPVRDQGLEGACWSFATYGAVESYWLKNGLSQEDLSEQNMVTCHDFDWLPSDGENYEIAMAYVDEARYLPGINDAGYNVDVIKQTVLD